MEAEEMRWEESIRAMAWSGFGMCVCGGGVLARFWRYASFGEEQEHGGLIMRCSEIGRRLGFFVQVFVEMRLFLFLANTSEDPIQVPREMPS